MGQIWDEARERAEISLRKRARYLLRQGRLTFTTLLGPLRQSRRSRSTPALGCRLRWVAEAERRVSLERHYSVQEIAASWNVSEMTVRRLFMDEPGVLRIGEGTKLLGRRYKRRYYVLRIPESVVTRVRARLLHQGREAV